MGQGSQHRSVLPLPVHPIVGHFTLTYPVQNFNHSFQTRQVPREELYKQIDHVNKTRCHTLLDHLYFLRTYLPPDYDC